MKVYGQFDMTARRGAYSNAGRRAPPPPAFAAAPVAGRLNPQQVRYLFVVTGYIACCLIAVFVAHSEQRQFLADVATDGYTNQVYYIWNFFTGLDSIFAMEPIYWIHALRALVAYVFTSIEDVGGGGLVTATMMVLTYPVAKLFFGLRRGYLIFALPLACLFVSERAFLVVIAVAYMLVFIRGGNTPYFLGMSFILSNLSSGSVMNNLVIASTVARNYRPHSLGLYAYIALQTFSLVISASDKYLGFTEQRSGYDATVYGASGIEAILSRSTIFVSLIDGNYLRLVAYVALGLLAFGLLAFSLRSTRYRGYVLILASVVPSLMFEGLGFMSLLVPMLLFLAGEEMPWRPDKKHG